MNNYVYPTDVTKKYEDQYVEYKSTFKNFYYFEGKNKIGKQVSVYVQISDNLYPLVIGSSYPVNSLNYMLIEEISDDHISYSYSPTHIKSYDNTPYYLK